MANSHSLFYFLFLSVVLFLSNCSKNVEMAYGFKEKSVKHGHHKHVIAINSLIPAKVCSTPSEGSKTLSKLQVASKYGACSPLKGGKTTPPSLQDILVQDKVRTKHLFFKSSNEKSVSSSSGVKLTAYSGSGDYLFTVGFGTPVQSFTVIFDTGSDLAWLQCLPCSDYCLPQQDPYFNPSSSSTYSYIPCGSAACNQLVSATGYSESCTTDCIYLITYGDGSYSEGYWSTETLTLSSSAVFPNFEFGCGDYQGGNFGGADGLIGLGRNTISAVSQTSQQYGKNFSYCLPSTTSYTGYLAFGNQVAASSVQYISLLTQSSYPSFYFVDLTGISVGGTMLNVASSVFTTAGTIIDSGTTLTYLPPTAYSALRSAFKQKMTNYRTAPPQSGLDTCYNLKGYTTVTLPSIMLQFDGSKNFNVDGSGILIEANTNIYCLAFYGNSASTDFSIFGNTQQKTYEVMYDVTGGMLGFTPNSCA